MENIELIEITKDNISMYPPRCFLNPTNAGQMKKTQWLKEQMKHGMKVKLLYKQQKLIGYIEYVPGEFAWRAVNANNYLFIHCIWITPKKIHGKGYGSFLINECIKDAEKQNMLGVAVVTSKGPFMADHTLFLKNDFTKIDEKEPFSLLVKKVKQGKNPTIRNFEKQLAKFKGLHIVYADQCPWVSRFIVEMQKRFEELNISITQLKTAKDAQNAPSLYATFNLIYNGKIYVDHYISQRRFENIIKKEIKLET